MYMRDKAGRRLDSFDVPESATYSDMPGVAVAGQAGSIAHIVDETGAPSRQFLAGLGKTHPKPLPVKILQPNFIPVAGGDTQGNLLKGIANQANKYAMGTIIPTRYPGTGVAQVAADTRRSGSTALCLAATVVTGTHSDTITGKTYTQVRDAAVRLVRESADQHSVNRGGWGGLRDSTQTNNDATASWQAAQNASLVGAAGWLLWNVLTPETKVCVQRMVEWEADRFLDYRVPYWKNLAGVVQSAGDTKSEEVAWNASILALAISMMPAHVRAVDWMSRLVEMTLASYSREADVSDTVAVNGASPQDILRGWNANPDSTVVNHGLIHPDYMVSNGTSLLGIAGWSWTAMNSATPRCVDRGMKAVYTALATLNFPSPTYNAPGGTIYNPDGTVYLPQGNDWGTKATYVSVALFDTLARRFGWDAGAATPAATWEALHWQQVADMQARYTDGHTYADATENSEGIAEEGVAHRVAMALLTHCAPGIRRTNAVPSIVIAQNRKDIL
ncbi:hypothetical protein ACMTN4_07530 [Rhodococcus globerulus]|uniref:hypothetical protein n=1 Tax=Rhodococcus globerulus TaxID=33008 RepID=UPI0039E8FD17